MAGPGPMHSIVNDFWTMVWEKKSHAIVMLGQLKENKVVIMINKTTQKLHGCFIRMFVLSIGQIKTKLSSMASFQLRQFQRMYGVKAQLNAFLN